jgi:hypothetical protein
MPDWLGAVLCIALVGWAVLGFWRGLSLPKHYYGVGMPSCAPAWFSPWGVLRYGRMYRGYIAESYDADGNRIQKGGKPGS